MTMAASRTLASWWVGFFHAVYYKSHKWDGDQYCKFVDTIDPHKAERSTTEDPQDENVMYLLAVDVVCLNSSSYKAEKNIEQWQSHSVETLFGIRLRKGSQIVCIDSFGW